MKIINIVLGVATAIILGALINLGIKAFYPEPVAPSYPNVPVAAPCGPNDAVCLKANDQATAQANAAQDQFNQQEAAYENAMAVYNKNVFIIANIIGIIVFALGFFLVFGDAAVAARGVPIGIMLAGLWSIVYGYGRGWGSVDDILKFFVGLVIALLVIGGSMWLMQRHERKAGQSPRVKRG
jgi:heme/copper-type cytochrome/quinol oxidase subunit 4